MAFKTNDSQQYSLTDSMNNLTSRELEALEKSWAKVFAEDIFPAIDEEPFRVLYSSRTQCRANTPVNICVGARIIKEMFQNSDDDIVESLMLDTRYQYALHTTSYKEQPLSDKTLSRFRERCYNYEAAYGVDLLHDCITGLSKQDSSVLQNPSDPDATFREKAGKQHRGYVANVDEAVGKNGSVVLDYQLEQNNYSDSQFLKDSLERNGSQEEGSVVVTDGAYFGEENSRLAQKRNINLVTTAITGIEVPEIYADFLLNEEGTRVLKCPAGHTPKSSCCSRGGGGYIYVSFPREQCMNCPHKERCRVKVHKKVCSLTISATAQFRAKAKRMMGTEEFHLLARLRSGVETLPSITKADLSYRPDAG